MQVFLKQKPAAQTPSAKGEAEPLPVKHFTTTMRGSSTVVERLAESGEKSSQETAVRTHRRMVCASALSAELRNILRSVLTQCYSNTKRSINYGHTQIGRAHV